MQEFPQNYKLHHFNICTFFIKLILLALCCCLLVCCEQKQVKQILSAEPQTSISESAVNINLASAAELEKLPHIGAKSAQEIIEYRSKFGRFRKLEHLLLVRGISERDFQEIKNLIKVE
jgi:competence ComEA-like helix-hairpin-helix protein